MTINKITLIKKCAKYAALLTTLSIGILLGSVLRMLYYNADIPSVLWCGTTIVQPLAFAANYLIPFGFICHFAALGVIFIQHERVSYITVLHLTAYVFFAVILILIGFHYCLTRLEGFSFQTLVWWL